MKRLSTLIIVFLLALHLGSPVYAQMEESRTKIEMTIVSGGKTVITELSSVSTSLSRSYEETVPASAPKDSVKKDGFLLNAGSVSLNMEVKRVTDDLLKIFGKKKNQFDGTITVVDTYGKIPTRTFKFKGATLLAYSEQVSSVSYGDTYGSAFFSITCSDITINGIAIE